MPPRGPVTLACEVLLWKLAANVCNWWQADIDEQSPEPHVLATIGGSVRLHCWIFLAVVTLPVSLGSASATHQIGKSSHVRRIERYRLTQSGGGLGIDIEEAAVFSAEPGSASDWFVERHRTEDNWCGRRENNACSRTTVSVHQWITSTSCPALQDVMNDLPVAQSAARAIQREQAGKHIFVTDTPLFTLETLPERRGATLKQSEWTGPLVDWWWHAQDRLKPCWANYPI